MLAGSVRALGAAVDGDSRVAAPVLVEDGVAHCVLSLLSGGAGG